MTSCSNLNDDDDDNHDIMYLPIWKRWVRRESCSTKRQCMRRWCVQQTTGRFAPVTALAVEYWQTQPVEDNQSRVSVKRRGHINVLWNNNTGTWLLHKPQTNAVISWYLKTSLFLYIITWNDESGADSGIGGPSAHSHWPDARLITIYNSWPDVIRASRWLREAVCFGRGGKLTLP